MAFTKLSVGKAIELAFGDRQIVAIDESKVLLLRDGKDLESELTARQKLPTDLTFTLSRTPLGDVTVTATRTR